MEPGAEHATALDLAAVVDRAPLGLGVVGPDGRYVLANAAFARLLGTTPDAMIGQDALSFLHPDDRETGRYALEQLFGRTVQEASADMRYVRVDGVEVCARVTAATLYDDTGVTGVVLQGEDVTAVRAAGEAQAEMTSLVAVLDEAVLTLSSVGRIRSWNAGAARLLGWSADDVVGQPLDVLLPPERKGELADLLARFTRGETVRTESTWLHKDGARVEVGLAASPVLDQHSRLTSAIGVVHDIAEQKRVARRLDHLARHDPLTGLPNRREFNERLENALAAGRRSGEVVGLLFADLDGFKDVNDVHGHQVGDEFLRVIGARLHGAIRPADSLARWGGDEYAVLVEHAESTDDLVAVARRLLSTLHRTVHIRGHDLPASVSIGIATSQDADTPEALLRAADHAMYRAKNRGGNQYALVPGPAG